ncbi:hypothetical protein [Oryzifoliimicrobium ureilyticus]|uniref:hypothetical protein n=1 Tax=Oryzifoliimicrobium ureilyticus TaxID=3113724 RepID=UPI00307637CD
MIRGKLSASDLPLYDNDVALCQKVFYHVCAAKKIKTREAREELARQIISLYQTGVTQEATLMRTLM